MKYLRKIIGLVIAVVFLATVIIGVGVIFAVKNVNVTLQSYVWADWNDMTEEEQALAQSEIDDIKNIVLGNYRGKLMAFVNSDNLAADFDDTNYILESCEKVYPCTLNITIKERREVFIEATGNSTYSTYDSYGTLMRSGLSEEEAVNNVDKAPNIYVYGMTSSGDIVKVAEAASVFAETFSSLRSMVESIELNQRAGSIIFNLRCGIEIYVSDYYTLTDIKMQDSVKAAYNKFMSLTGEEKLSGRIMVKIGTDALTVNAVYWSEEDLEKFPD